MKITIIQAPWRSPAALAAGVILLIATIPAQALRLPAAPSKNDFPGHREAKVELGMLLFYDKILSGNENMSCASCHHALAFTGDGLSLPVGEGGRGLGIARDTGTGADAIHARVPRNAPQFFNAGAYEFKEMFWDGRVEEDASYPSGYRSPAATSPLEDKLPPGLDNSLAVQAMFPPTSPEEMAGQAGENPVAIAASAGNLSGPGGVWEQLAQRVRDIDEYLDYFKAAYPGEVKNKADITMVHIANAIAAYEDMEFRTIDTPFDRFLRGDRRAMSQNQRAGMRLFYGKAGCSDCHSGKFQTDHQYHAVGTPQIGPGKGDTGPGGDSYGDFGRERVTGDPADRYKFRTPPLRNTALTGPWGHDGAYDSLEAVIRHKMNPAALLENYDPDQAVLPSRLDLDAIDLVHHDDPGNRAAIAAAIDPLLTTPRLKDREVALLIEFLRALTDPSKVDLRRTVPASVPSGLPLAD